MRSLVFAVWTYLAICTYDSSVFSVYNGFYVYVFIAADCF